MIIINNTKTENIKKERLKKGRSYADMANFLGYKSRTTYMYLEKGMTNPSIDVMNNISKLLGKPVQYFFNLNVQETGSLDNVGTNIMD